MSLLSRGFAARNDYSLSAFIANERSKTLPPQLRRATLRQIAEGLLSAGDAAELDVLLLPKPQSVPGSGSPRPQQLGLNKTSI